jgi:polyisoprenoid-binding protein YceI
MKALKILVAAAVLFAAGDVAAASWQIDPNHSSVEFKIRHFFSKVTGSFTDWSGAIEFDPENPRAGSVQVVIQTASIDTKNEQRDDHLRSDDFFDAENHPTLTFQSTEVRETEDGWEMVGDLTMRGVTQQVVIPFEFLGSGPDAWGGTRAGFEGETEVNRKDFGISWNKLLDSGGAVLGDDVEIELHIEAVLAQEG